MSELTPCNYCNLQRFRARAKTKGARVLLRSSAFMNGLNVFEVPKGEKLAPQSEMVEPNDQYPNGNDAYDKYHIAWFMGLSEGCCC